MNTQKIVTTTMDNDYEQIVIRQCSEPTEQVSKIYTNQKYKPKPLTRKKFVVPPPEVKKTERRAMPELFSD